VNITQQQWEALWAMVATIKEREGDHASDVVIERLAAVGLDVDPNESEYDLVLFVQSAMEIGYLLAADEFSQ